MHSRCRSLCHGYLYHINNCAQWCQTRKWHSLPRNLGCTDAAKWPLHPRPMRQRAGTPLPACRTASSFFFFSFLDSCRLASIRLRRAPTRAKPGWFAPIRAESDRIGRIPVCFGPQKEIGRWKKKYLKAKIPMDLMRHCRHLHWP